MLAIFNYLGVCLLLAAKFFTDMKKQDLKDLLDVSVTDIKTEQDVDCNLERENSDIICKICSCQYFSNYIHSIY